MKFTHAFDLKMTGKKFKLEEKSTFKHVLLFIKTKVTASFELRTCNFKVGIYNFNLGISYFKVDFFSTLKLLS